MKRTLLSQLKEWLEKKNRKPLVLKGARQVGKTYLLREFGKQSFKAFHYIDLEKEKDLHPIFSGTLNPKSVIDQLQLHFKCLINPLSDLLIFDEIQACPRALTSLKYFYEEMPELAICTAGSLIGIHLSEESFPVGKVDFLTLYPMTFEEFLLGIGDTHGHAYLAKSVLESIPEFAHQYLLKQLKTYFVTGGLPEVVDTYSSHQQEGAYKSFLEVRKKQQALISAYLADVAKHSGKENAMHIDRVWTSIADQLSRTQDQHLPKYIFKGVIPGKNRYSQLVGPIDWLVNAGLIFKISIVNTSQTPLRAYATDNLFKLAFFDIGILGAISHLNPQSILDSDYGTYKGYVIESYLAQALATYGINSLYSWQENTSEIEFLVESQGHIIPIEVKSGFNTKSKSLKVYATRYKPSHQLIFSFNPSSTAPKTGILRYPLYAISHGLKKLELAPH